MSQVLVTFANSKNNYVKGVSRLVDSLKYNWENKPIMAFIGENTLLGCPLHTVEPYAFKIFAIQAARDAGHSQVLWLDASCFAIQNIQPIFDHINEHGYIMQDAGHWIGQWSSDIVLEYFGMNRDEAMTKRMYGNAGFLGLNFDNPVACQFFDEWRKSMEAGMFRGAWDNDKKTESQDERCTGSRHDMSCGSIIANRMGMELQPSDKWMQYGGPYDKRLNNEIYIMAQGL